MGLDGTESTNAHIDSVYYLDEELTDSRIQRIPGLGHLAPELGSKPVADALVEFFTRDQNNN